MTKRTDETTENAEAVNPDVEEEEYDEEEITFGLSLADLRTGIKENVPVEYPENNLFCTISFKTDFMKAEDEEGLYERGRTGYFRTLAKIIPNAVTKWDLKAVVVDKNGKPIMEDGKPKTEIVPITEKACVKVLYTDMLRAIWEAMNKALLPNPETSSI